MKCLLGTGFSTSPDSPPTRSVKVDLVCPSGLSRLALKLATGAGKTAVMAMLIAWQTVNAVRRPNSPRFTRGFLVVTPGITIRDRPRRPTRGQCVRRQPKQARS